VGADPKVQASAVPSEAVSIDASATASALASAPPSDPPSVDAGKAGLPKFPLTLQPLGAFVTAVAKEIEPVKEIPRDFEPGVTKPQAWVNVSERTVAGNAKLRSWDFSGRWAWILTLERSSVRVATWRDVRERWSLDDTKEHLLLVRSIKDEKGASFRQHIIVDLATLAEHPLPTTDCTRNAMFRDGRVIGYSTTTSTMTGKALTAICAFELDGTPIARLMGLLDWDHARAAALASPIGLLPPPSKVFYALVTNADGDDYLFTVDVSAPSHTAAFEVEARGFLDVKDFNIDHPVLGFTDTVSGIRRTITAKKLYAR
jgi:hypothetical protein